MVWPHSEEELDQFLTHMNRANESIQFTSEKSTKEIVFLDVTVYKEKNKTDNNSRDVDTCTLQTKTYIKPTNKQLYVRKGSYHPKGTDKDITVGEAIRYLCTNSDPNNFSSMLMQHKRNLIKRGYSGGEINRHLRNIKFSMRASKALKSKHETDDTDTRKKTHDDKSGETHIRHQILSKCQKSIQNSTQTLEHHRHGHTGTKKIPQNHTQNGIQIQQEPDQKIGQSQTKKHR